MAGSDNRVNCEPVGLDYFDRAPFCFVASEVVRVSPERVFELFLDPDSWTRWVPVITRVEWTSPPPVELGATRTVTMRGSMVGYEEFIAWDPPGRMAFRFDQTSKKMVVAFAEDYAVKRLDDGSSRIDWRMAMTPIGIQRLTMKPFAPVMGAALRHTLRRFKKYAESDPVIAAVALPKP